MLLVADEKKLGPSPKTAVDVGMEVVGASVVEVVLIVGSANAESFPPLSMSQRWISSRDRQGKKEITINVDSCIE